MKNDKTNNIYTSWLETVDCNGYPSNRIKQLSSFSMEDLQHLKWLIEQEVESRRALEPTNHEHA